MALRPLVGCQLDHLTRPQSDHCHMPLLLSVARPPAPPRRAEGRIGGRRDKLDGTKRCVIAEAVISGRKTAAQMARMFGVSPPTVSRMWWRQRSVCRRCRGRLCKCLSHHLSNKTTPRTHGCWRRRWPSRCRLAQIPGAARPGHTVAEGRGAWEVTQRPRLTFRSGRRQALLLAKGGYGSGADALLGDQHARSGSDC
jgi:hypothetical protein